MAKKIFNGLLIVLFLIALSVDATWTYFNIFAKELIPTAVVSTYVTSVTNPITGEDLNAFEVNYYSNKNGKGIEVVEFLINQYSGTDKQALYPKGFQLVKFEDGSTTFTYYAKSIDDSVFIDGNVYDQDQPMIVDIDGDTYGIKLDGTYTEPYVVDTTSVILSAGLSPLALVYNWINHGSAFNFTQSGGTYDYTYSDLLNYFKTMLKSNTNGTGDYTIPMIDLGNYFSVYDENDQGQFTVQVGDKAFQNSYFTIDAHYDYRGLTMAKQSIFGSVAGNADYNTTGITEDSDYWKDTTTIILSNNTKDTFIIRNNYISMNLEKIADLNSYENIEVEIVLDVTYLRGFDYGAFSGLKINKMTLISEVVKDFEINNTLENTGLTITDIICNNVNLVGGVA